MLCVAVVLYWYIIRVDRRFPKQPALALYAVTFGMVRCLTVAGDGEHRLVRGELPMVSFRR